MRVVVIGGLGNFGARICARLAHEPGIEIIATSRHRVAGTRSSGTAMLDIDSPELFSRLRCLAPELVIHCAGPFQGQDYRVALAALACGAHYVDLADGREFVAGFSAAVGPAARAAGRMAVTGASSLSALSSAVVDFLASSLSELSTIDVVIAPGQHARRGAATVAAVVGYAGQPFSWLERGAWRTVYGWQALKRQRFSFGGRLSAACNVPDLDLFPRRYPEIRTATFRAALEVSLQHYGLWLIAAFRRMGLPLSMSRWAAPLDRIGTWLNWLGGQTGGMLVHVVGRNRAGNEVSRRWELVAGHNHGPEIPGMASVLIAIKLARKDPFAAGATVCLGMLALTEFEAEFARWDISTMVVDEGGQTGCLALV